MNAIKARFPSKHEVAGLFYICVFIFHMWSIPVFLYQVPGMILYMNIWELIHVVAYNQALILMECVLVSVSLVLLATILPGKYFRTRFIFQGTFVITLTTLSSILLNQMESFILKIYPGWFAFVSEWGLLSPNVRRIMASDSFIFSIMLIVLLSTWSSLLVLSPHITRRFKRGPKYMLAFANKISVLSGLFIGIDVLGLIMIVGKNIS